jgi:hypothetical protein
VRDRDGRSLVIVPGYDTGIWEVQDQEARTLYRIEALRVTGGVAGELLVATTPQCSTPGVTRVSCLDVAKGLGLRSAPADAPTNIFSVDIATGEATYIATGTYTFDMSYVQNWSLDADENYVVWNGAYCFQRENGLKIYDRKTGAIRETTLGYTHVRNGRLGVGEFSAKSLYDAATLQLIAELPRVVFRWSDDYRYATPILQGAGGGYCRP